MTRSPRAITWLNIQLATNTLSNEFPNLVPECNKLILRIYNLLIESTLADNRPKLREWQAALFDKPKKLILLKSGGIAM